MEKNNFDIEEVLQVADLALLMNFVELKVNLKNSFFQAVNGALKIHLVRIKKGGSFAKVYIQI